VIDAAERFKPMTEQQQAEAIRDVLPYQPISVPGRR